MPSARRSRKNAPANPEAEWYGFEKVAPGDKTARVRRVFDSVAPRYDLMNDLMSGGLHRLWKDRLAAMMNPRPGQTILDAAGGTGDIALRSAAKTEGKARIIVCDINPAMLEAGRGKAIDRGWLGSLQKCSSPERDNVSIKRRKVPLPLREGLGEGYVKVDPSPAKTKDLPKGKSGFLLPLPQGERVFGIEWVTGNAEDLPFPGRSMDTVCIAFGLRNVTRIDAALGEFARVLKPGGRFFCLEFSPGVPPWLKELYDLYSFAVLPWLGEHIAEDREAYQYLAESIRKFPDQPSLAKRMEKAGFANVQWRNLTGGIAVIHSGWRL
ncbi:MAG: class I SAM-dependent methyltransferase [Alphaproteobacteria bacterium]|nr:class I SAM-dependent methyltransferase [Alphaproteobacteria bacterium]